MDYAIALFNIFLFLSYLCLVFCCLYYDEINIYIGPIVQLFTDKCRSIFSAHSGCVLTLTLSTNHRK